MSEKPILFRKWTLKWILRVGVLALVLASAVVGLVLKGNLGSVHASGASAKYTFIVFLDGGRPELYNSTNAPFINSLKASGANYTSAQAQVPADSVTNIMGAVTGTDATHHGFLYETFWDRQYNHLIELDETPVLPPGITEDRNVGRACTLFQSAKAAGLTTAFISKYPAYDILDGPSSCSVYSGSGVDNLQTPTFQDFLNNGGTPSAYDQMNFDTIRSEILSSNRPNLFGLYAVAPNTIMKQYGINSSQTAAIINFEDNQIRQTVEVLKQAGIYNQTDIIITNDHGNTAINTTIPDSGPGSIDQFLNDNGIPTVQTTADRVALVWLKNPLQTPQAYDLLSTSANKAKFGIQGITLGPAMAQYMAVPANRTPDLSIWPTDGSNGTPAVVYAGSPGKLAEHGGRGASDQNIMLVLEGPGIPTGYTYRGHVWEMQIGPTIARTMGLQLPNATFSALPGC